MIRPRILLGLTCLVLWGQAPDSAQNPLLEAYESLRARRYDTAIRFFRKAIDSSPDNAVIHKDLAYAYLKVGETEAARDEFAEAMRLDELDFHVALEYAFLCHETGKTAIARRTFDQIRKEGDPESRTTAETAFQKIDGALAEGIDRWSKAVKLSPGDFSAHHELARLAEERDRLQLAADHYLKAWQLRPELRSVLLELGRVWKGLGLMEDANSAFLAASRSTDTRVAETARQSLPSRYPYPYEFRRALDLDGSNLGLRRELAFLLLAMDKKDEAEQEFLTITKMAPDDLLSAAQLGFLYLARKKTDAAMPLLQKVLKGEDQELADRVRKALKLPQALRRSTDHSRQNAAVDAKTLAQRSYDAGYLRDALKYFTIAHESDPLDFSVMLKLGWTHNVLGEDDKAIPWFEMARKSPEPPIAAEARKAHRNLRPSAARFRTAVWFFPSYSSRWRDVFSYGQAKAEMRLGCLPLRSYLSARFIGDTRRVTGEALPQFLSESSVVFGAGLATDYWHGLMFWAEAGSAFNYTNDRYDAPRMAPDYRGGLSFSKGFGRLLGGESGGSFFETNDDAVFISRFQDDVVLYWQNRLGYTLPAFGSVQTQLYWNGNASLDLRRQYWANTVEFGPGVRFRLKTMPRSCVVSVNFLRGAYTLNEGNPRRPNFFDLRIGFWYAFTR